MAKTATDERSGSELLAERIAFALQDYLPVNEENLVTVAHKAARVLSGASVVALRSEGPWQLEHDPSMAPFPWAVVQAHDPARMQRFIHGHFREQAEAGLACQVLNALYQERRGKRE